MIKEILPNKKRDMENLPLVLLNVRNFVEEYLTKHPNVKFGGSAGVGVEPGAESADLDILIEGHRFNIRIQPRLTRIKK